MKKLMEYKLSKEQITSVFGGESQNSSTTTTTTPLVSTCTDTRTVIDSSDGKATISDCTTTVCPDDAPKPNTLLILKK